MTRSGSLKGCLAGAVLFLASISQIHADGLDTIGVLLLRQVDPTLQGSNAYVAQVEAPDGADTFEVNPGAQGQPTNLFTWISRLGTSTNFTNTVGFESGHANGVAANFYSTTNGAYGTNNGVAPGVAHIYNYEAEFFITNVVDNGLSITSKIVNQSFILDMGSETGVNQIYDNYAHQYGTLFVSAVNNGISQVPPPASCYNGIAVGLYNGTSSTGPTTDGRCKPDLISPAGSLPLLTSFATPYVSGSAAVLLQAARRGDGGSNTNAASNARTLKALLLNGAVKPIGWTNGPRTPFDARYGAGVVNVFNSWQQMKGGKQAFIEATAVNANTNHPPGSNTNNVPALSGWDTNSLSTINQNQDKINHYYFNLPGTNSYSFTTTLVWSRHQSETLINDLNLFLYNVANTNLVLCSTSLVDNVEHLFVSELPPGRYDLQVLKRGTGQVTSTEGYSLAFEIFNISLSISLSSTNAVVSWPIAPTGFRLMSATNLNPPSSWAAVTAAVSVNTNTARNSVSQPATNNAKFFRLQRP